MLIKSSKIYYWQNLKNVGFNIHCCYFLVLVLLGQK